jgi:hypothetical protein
MSIFSNALSPERKQRRLSAFWKKSGLGALVVLMAGLAPSTSLADSTYTAMYFHSQVRDGPTCAMNADSKGVIGFPASLSNPVATCPDASAWKQLLDAITHSFWDKWGNDETLWISDPRPLCATSSQNDCCFVSTKSSPPQVGYRDTAGKVVKPSDVGGPGQFCPYIPGDWGGATETTFAGAKPVTSHNTTFLHNFDPDRIARQREVEVIYRNDAFMRYTTKKNIYSLAGLQALFGQISGEAANSKPYRPMGQGVSYPPDAVMFKVDWIPEATMVELKYVHDHDNNSTTPPQNPKHPYITMKMNVSIGSSTEFKEGMYYLASITGSSKALPNWHWYAFEHVENRGRCDFTGCNDSYGYTTKVTTPAPIAGDSPVTFDSNFITPLTIDDQLKDGSSLFKLGQKYPSGTITTGLAALFEATGVGGGGELENADVPNISDLAWTSYRLKGTQTQFYNRDGSPTIVGASITEGGFVNTSSCMSCHVQASVANNPELIPVPFGVPGVGASGRLNMFGMGEVVNGAPDTGDYFNRGTTTQRAVQTDFVWGAVINAQ